MSIDALIGDVLELAAIPAPTFSEASRIEWLERKLAEAGGRRYRDEAGNLIWAWGDGRPRVLVAAHVDTVFPVDTELRFEETDGWIVGPGIGDNAAAVATTLHVVDALLEAGVDAPGAVAFTVGEEGLGNLRGAIAACAELEPEAFVAVEGHGLDHVLVDAVGSVRARVRLTGPGGHSWVDRARPSATHALLGIGRSLVDASSTDAPVNIGLLTGGQSVNTIAAEAELVVEARALDGAALDAFVAELGRFAVEPPLALDVEIIGRRPAGGLERDSPLLTSVLAVRADLGLPETLGEGSTDANAALAAGIPALALGIANGDGMHTRQERIEACSLELGAAQLRGVLERLLV